MTDKDIKDYCKNCAVEPPAMKFKCPECEHNPDKEQIIQGTNYKEEALTAIRRHVGRAKIYEDERK